MSVSKEVEMVIKDVISRMTDITEYIKSIDDEKLQCIAFMTFRDLCKRVID